MLIYRIKIITIEKEFVINIKAPDEIVIGEKLLNIEKNTPGFCRFKILKKKTVK